MIVVPGIVSLGLAAISSSVVCLSARVFAARALTGRGLLVALGLDHAPWVGMSIARKIPFALSGPFACYLLASFLFATSVLRDGKPVTDSRNMHVWVTNDGAAATAGIRGGDEILSIDDVPVLSFSELAEQIGKHPGATLRIAVRHRDAKTQVFDVVPGANGKLGVITQQENEHVGFGSAIALGTLAVPRMWMSVARHIDAIFSGSPGTHALAPLIFGSHSGRVTLGGVCEHVATLVGYYFFILTILLALIFWPGARWFASATKTAEK